MNESARGERQRLVFLLLVLVVALVLLMLTALVLLLLCVVVLLLLVIAVVCYAARASSELRGVGAAA